MIYVKMTLEAVRTGYPVAQVIDQFAWAVKYQALSAVWVFQSKTLVMLLRGYSTHATRGFNGRAPIQFLYPWLELYIFGVKVALKDR